jgi:DNA-binding protein H-NS
MNDLTLITDDDSGSDKNIHRVEHSSVIAPGRHWQCLTDVKGISVRSESKEFEFEAGLLYLLTRLEFFEGKLHSVRLLDDPSASTESGILTLDLFLASFEQVTPEDAKEFRAQQIAEVQKRVADVQQEMADAQTDPTLLQPLIEKGLRKWEREVARKNGEEEPGKANLPTVTTNGHFATWRSARARLPRFERNGLRKKSRR